MTDDQAPDAGHAHPRSARRPRWALAMAAGGAVAASGAALFGLDRAMRLTAGELTLAGGALAGLGGLIFTAGLAYYVLAPGLRGGPAAWRGVGSHRLVLACTLLVILVSNTVPLVWLALVPARGLCSVPGFLTAALPVGLALLGVTYVRFIRPGILTRADLGVRLDRLGRDVSLGLMVGLAVLIASALVQLALQGLGVRQTQLADLQCIRGFPLWGFFAVLFAGGVLAPVAEELFFRGYVFRSYLRVRGPLTAYVATSLLFASLHLNLPALVPILFLSLIFCWAYQRTGSIVPSIVGHSVNNSTAFLALYFGTAPL
jgi:uncharacterized protein